MNERDKLVIKRLREMQSEIGDIIQYISERDAPTKEPTTSDNGEEHQGGQRLDTQGVISSNDI